MPLYNFLFFKSINLLIVSILFVTLSYPLNRVYMILMSKKEMKNRSMYYNVLVNRLIKFQIYIITVTLILFCYCVTVELGKHFHY